MSDELADRGPVVVALDAASVDALAHRVAQLLATSLSAPEPAGPARLLTAAEVSNWWGVDRGWIYQHADQLGVVRIGDGARPRLRFHPDRVAQALGARQPAKPDNRRPAPMAGDQRLLPIRG